MKLIRCCDIAVVLLASSLVLWPAVSYAESDLDVTMRMVTDDDALSDSIVQRIQLPEPDPVAADGSRPADQANGRRESGERGNRSAPDNIGDRGRHLGESISDRAFERRHDIDNPQPHKPDLPGKPDIAKGQ